MFDRVSVANFLVDFCGNFNFLLFMVLPCECNLWKFLSCKLTEENINVYNYYCCYYYLLQIFTRLVNAYFLIEIIDIFMHK